MSIIYKKIILIFLIYVYFMIIYVNITDRQTHQKYSLEPHKIEIFNELRLAAPENSPSYVTV